MQDTISHRNIGAQRNELLENPVRRCRRILSRDRCSLHLGDIRDIVQTYGTMLKVSRNVLGAIKPAPFEPSSPEIVRFLQQQGMKFMRAEGWCNYVATFWAETGAAGPPSEE